jgi:hypothetical protein
VASVQRKSSHSIADSATAALHLLRSCGFQWISGSDPFVASFQFKFIKAPMLAFSGTYPDIMDNVLDNGTPGTQYIANIDSPSCEFSLHVQARAHLPV